ncbi:MAG: CNP1-like family protein [Azovibrio sp.]|uniref:CNP1-like family protein n=1 Tax=Azovibrio sp. TaxID=1872673 RepID=UPI003C72F428
MNSFVRTLCALFLAGLAVQAQAAFDEEFEEKPWEEIAVQLPPFPKDENFLSFYVSPTATNRFFLDTESLSVGSDGVVRYVLLALSDSGVRNITFEGMRCQTREWRIYAVGRPDGGWSKARSNQWKPVREQVTNRQHAALFTDLLCPDGVIAFRVSDILRALKKEGRPLSKAP